MNKQMVTRFCFIFFLLGFLQNPGYSVAENSLCLATCFKSGKLIHEYISDLKEEIRAKNVELRKAQDYAKDNLIDRLRTENEDLRRILWEFSQQRNTISRVESNMIDFMIMQKNAIQEGKLKAAKNQKDLKKEMEELRKIALNVKYQVDKKPTPKIKIKINNQNQMERKPRSQSEIEMNLKKEIENLKKNLEKEKANGNKTLKTVTSKKKE
ncbi:uncharacterized protein LOC111519477 [Drosophila willistoni]|uniref:uncharacterized protein LOC111519477 n=1 Tax=Drosophila willistoni TaxID=7260 RepID=UPI000C26C14F|nr:uncharacterized protein LOC111519477 [Drosophila willistoni]